MKETENLIFFQCKIEFYFIEWTPKALFSLATRENNAFGVHSMK